MELGKQHQRGPQNSFPISARGLEGFNIPHLGRIVHHAVQTPQNVPLATASATKSCRAFFCLLFTRRETRRARPYEKRNIHPPTEAHPHRQAYTTHHRHVTRPPVNNPAAAAAHRAAVIRGVGWPQKSIKGAISGKEISVSNQCKS